MIKKRTIITVIVVFLLSFPEFLLGEEVITHSTIACGGAQVTYYHDIPTGSHDRQFCHVDMDNIAITQIDACFSPFSVGDGISLFVTKPNEESLLIVEYEVASVDRKFNHVIPWYADNVYFVIRHNKDSGSNWSHDLNSCDEVPLFNWSIRQLTLCEGDPIDLRSLQYEGSDYYILDKSIDRNIEYLPTNGIIGVMSERYEGTYLVKTLTADREVMVETVVLSMSAFGTPDVSLTLSRNHVCVGDTVHVYVAAPDSSLYTWSHDFVGDDTLCIVMSHEIAIRVIIEAPGLCQVIRSITIHMKASPVIDHEIVVCEDAAGVLSVAPNMSYQSWFTASGMYIDSTAEVEVYPDQDTTWYFVEVGDTLGCHFVDSVSVVISRPADAGPDQNLCPGNGVMIIGSGGVEYNWNNEGFSRFPDYVVQPDIADGLEQIYQVEVLDEYDCISTDSVTIYLQLCCGEYLGIYFPNVASLNDDGINDLITAYASTSSLTGVVKIKSFRVYNRPGALMHEALNFLPDSDGITGAFNGIFKGQVIDVGVYRCEWVIECYDGTELQINKTITVVR